MKAKNDNDTKLMQLWVYFDEQAHWKPTLYQRNVYYVIKCNKLQDNHDIHMAKNTTVS